MGAVAEEELLPGDAGDGEGQQEDHECRRGSVQGAGDKRDITAACNGRFLFVRVLSVITLAEKRKFKHFFVGGKSSEESNMLGLS